MGCESLDGVLPSGNDCTSGWITFEFFVVQPNFDAVMSIRVGGSGSFVNHVTTRPGDKLDLKIEYRNTGNTTQNNVAIVLHHIPGTDLVPDGLLLVNPANPNGKPLGGDPRRIFQGVNIGNYNPGSNAFLRISFTIKEDGAVQCGGRWLVASAEAQTDNGNKTTIESTIDVVSVC